MKILRRKNRINEVPSRWAQQYTDRGTKEQKEITAKLLALKPPLSRGEIDKLIGNKSWTRLPCSGCETDSNHLIALSDDYSCDVNLCKQCLLDAIALFSIAEGSDK